MIIPVLVIRTAELNLIPEANRFPSVLAARTEFK